MESHPGREGLCLGLKCYFNQGNGGVFPVTCSPHKPTKSLSGWGSAFTEQFGYITDLL